MIDVCFLLEGTYPYVAGGVSTWVHQLISSMKDIRFGIIYIAPHSDPTRTIKYKMPDNIIYLKEIYLHDYDLRSLRNRKPNTQDLELIRNFYQDFKNERYDHFANFIRLFRGDDICLDTEYIFASDDIWQLLIEFYKQIDQDISFLDYFWTWRGTHLPLMQVLQADIPRAKVYHSVSTGYAGLLGSIAKCTSDGKFFLTEHGIYTHERTLEISQADWIYKREKVNFRAERDLSFFKRWWVNIFKIMSHVAYRNADQIFTLFEGNKIRQSLEGADENKISIIPNGINIDDFKELTITKKDSPQVALVGRVVNIKDVKTYIHAAKLVLEKIPEVQFYIIGPTDEEEDYYEECTLLVEALKLEDKIIFTGRVYMKDYLKFLDLVVLTSVSEAQPYVVLEANMCGIPVVASDVGACREMLHGRTYPDQNIGPSGLITEVSNPEDTAQAIEKLLIDKKLYEQYGQSGKERVKHYYDQDDLLSKYLNVYENYL